jgi:hypothetical protein
MIAPCAIDEAAGEWQLISAAMILAQHLNRLIRRRFSLAVEFSQPFFARRHFRRSPSVSHPVLRIGSETFIHHKTRTRE